MKNYKLSFSPLKTALIFLVLGYIWIFATDYLVHHFVKDPAVEFHFQTYKGWFFVTVSAVLIFFIFRHQLNKILSYKNQLEKEVRFRTIIEATVDGFVIINANGEIQRVNDAFAKMTGYTKAELTGMKFTDLLSPEFYTGFKEQLGIIMKKGYAIFETRHRKKGGGEINLEVSAKYVGQYGLIFIFLKDITKRKTFEKTLRRSESKYKALFEGINDAVFVHPLKNEGFSTFIEVNEIACKRLGYTREELLKLTPADISDPEEAKKKAAKESRSKLLRNQWQVFETMHITKTGKRFPVEISSRIFDLEGRPVIISQAKDITERKRAEEEMRRRIQFERLVNEISAELVGVDGKNINKAILRILATIGAYAHADRAYIFRFKNDGKRMENTYEWCAPGIESEIENLKNIPVEKEMPWFLKQLRTEKVFHIPDVASLPAEAQTERRHFEAQGIQSLICVAMESGGKVTGFLGFDCVNKKKSWTENEQSLLRFVSQSVSNVQKRTQTEKALKESEEKFRLIAENSIDVIWKTDTRLKFTYLSPSLYESTGYKPEEWIGTPLWKHIRWSVFARLARLALQFMKNTNKQKVAVVEAVFTNKQGQEFPVEIIGKPIIDEKGKLTGLQGSARDITDRVNARKKLEDSERHYRLLFQTNPVPLVLVDVEKLNFIDVNRATEKLLGYSKKDFSKMHLWDIRPEISGFSKNEIRKMMAEAQTKPIEIKLISKQGKTILAEPVVDIIRYKGVDAALVAFNDITILKEAEKRIIHSIIEGEDNERKRVSKEIHDSLGQNLTAASLNFDAIKNAIEQLDEKEVAKFTTGLEFLKSAIEESRNIAHNLMPKAIEDFGLIPSLTSLFNKIMESTDLSVKFYENLNDVRLNGQIELNLYRITQEAINNVIKHARASEIFIQLILHKNEIIYTFEDNGIGFDKTAVTESGKGMGLRSIFNRVISLSGEIELDTAPGRGTSITIEIPI